MVTSVSVGERMGNMVRPKMRCVISDARVMRMKIVEGLTVT